MPSSMSNSSQAPALSKDRRKDMWSGLNLVEYVVFLSDFSGRPAPSLGPPCSFFIRSPVLF